MKNWIWQCVRYLGFGRSPSTDITISRETAEYLTILLGQSKWGDREIRRRAASELGQVVKSLPNSNACFSKALENECGFCGRRNSK